MLNGKKISQQFVGDGKKGIAPDRTGAAQFINELLSWVLHNKPLGFTGLYRDLEDLAGFVTDQASSVKYIMEYIAIRLPEIK